MSTPSLVGPAIPARPRHRLGARMLSAASPARAGVGGVAGVVGVGPRAGRLAEADGPDEAVILSCRPSLWFILMVRAGWLAALLVAAVALGRLAVQVPAPLAQAAPALAYLAIVLLLLWNTFDWLCRAYVLTTVRIVRTSGVLVRVHREVPLRNVQSVTLVRTVRERLVGIGSLGVSSAGSDGIELSWYMIARPRQVLDTARDAVDRARGQPGPASGNLP